MRGDKNMGLFTSKGRSHLIGYKELTKDLPVQVLQDSENAKYYFPTMAPNRSPIAYTPKVGERVLKGQKIGQRNDFYVPIYSSVSGVVVANEKVFSAQLGIPLNHFVIQSDGKEEETTELNKVVSLESSKEEILEAIKESGIVGMGGAGFPTYVKYQTNANIDTLLINAVECEPFLTTDYRASIEEARLLIKGIKLLLKVSGASRCIVAIKEHKDEARDAIENEIDEETISVVEVKDVYPMGWEKALIKEVLGKTYEGLPSDVGCIVNNVQTVISIAKVLTTGKVITERLVTVSGDAVANPSNILVKLGTPASKVIAAAGGYTSEEVALIPGGPMCSKSFAFDTFPMLLQMGALTVLKFVKYDTQACLRCGECTMHCPSGLQPVEIQIAVKKGDVDRMIALKAKSCVECGMCSYVCPSHIEVTENMRKAKLQIRVKEMKDAKK
jgi:electron transport complex protein RnfC